MKRLVEGLTGQEAQDLLDELISRQDPLTVVRSIRRSMSDREQVEVIDLMGEQS